MRSQIPVAVFAYRRPDVLARTLASLRRDGVPLLYVFCDGAKGPADQAEVDAVRGLVRQIDWCACEVHEQTTNQGLGRSVLAAMSLVFERHEAAIAFEDDLVCVPGTYAYLTAALARYSHEARVMSVTAWTHPSVTPDLVDDQPYFDGKAECWAWGAWRRSWHGMEMPALDMVREIVASGGDIARYGPDMPIMAAEAEQRNLWAVRWWYHHLRRGGLCLRPPRSMVEHVGWDDRSTTSTPAMLFWTNPALAQAPAPPRSWPEPSENLACPGLWRRAILASGSGPFPEPEALQALEAQHFEAIHAALVEQDAPGWNVPHVDRDVLAFVDELLAQAAIRQGAELLELGCGTGSLTGHLCACGFQITAVDVAPTAIARARARLTTAGTMATLWAGDARELNRRFRPSSFDLVVDSLLLHNVVGYDRIRLLREVRQVLRPGGVFLVMTMCGVPRNPQLRQRFDARAGLVMNGSLAELCFRTPAMLRGELEGQGFAIVYERVRVGQEAFGEEDVYLAVARSVPIGSRPEIPLLGGS